MDTNNNILKINHFECNVSYNECVLLKKSYKKSIDVPNARAPVLRKNWNNVFNFYRHT